MEKLINAFYRFVYRSKTIKLKAPSGRNYIIEYNRSPFWTYEQRTLRNFFKDKINLWHGQVWLVYDGGSKCGFGTTCIKAMFPRRRMKRFLKNEVYWLEKIFSKEDENNA